MLRLSGNLIDSLSRCLSAVQRATAALPRSSSALGAAAQPIAFDGAIIRRATDIARYRAAIEAQRSSAAFGRMLNVRQRLPAWACCEQLVEQFWHSDVLVICGATGCGKTTQVATISHASSHHNNLSLL